MPGFTGVLSESYQLSQNDLGHGLICDQILIDKFSIQRNTINKFLNDKVFFENEKYFYLTEGVILNSLELNEKYGCNSFAKTVSAMHEKEGKTFFKKLKGSFSGAIYDKENRSIILYTDPIGSKQVFYYQNFDLFIFSSSINSILKILKETSNTFSFNEQSAYALLSFGYMIESNTMFKEINKLGSGHYLEYSNKKVSNNNYYEINNTPNYDISIESAIDTLDHLFKQAVRRAFEKDKEYGYKHLVALSGGLDSRMTTWVAHQLGYSDQIFNYTYSQSNYLDEIIPKKIASDLKHEWIFKSLDNGIFLKNVEDIVNLSFGGSLYYGLSHAKSLYDVLNFEHFGIAHSGQLGDVIVGTYYTSLDKDKQFSVTDGANSTVLSHKIDKSLFKKNYANQEIFKLYTRGFLGVNQGLLAIQEHTETYSPFCDIDFFNFCLSLPLEYRFDHKIYFEWILKKHPNAANYIWETTGRKIKYSHIKIFGKKITKQKILKKLGIRFINSRSMNPFDYWYNTNNELRDFMIKYYNKNISLLDLYPDLKNDCNNLWSNYNMVEKCQVMTLLAFMKIYFDSN